MKSKLPQIKDVLESLYARYNHRDFADSDPVQFVYRYSNREDMEIAAFLAAELAYGRVEQIKKSLTLLFGHTGDSLFKFVRNFDKDKRNKLKNFKHRFTSGDCLSNLLELLRDIISGFGSIENFFVSSCNKNDININNALSKFCDSLLAIYAKTHNGYISREIKYLLPSPASGSACKRLNLFLRWMVRKDEIDTGLWKSIDKSKLIVPVDVHMGRLCRILGFYSQKTISLSAAVKITESFAKIEPSDPVKYDFALSRIGIIENCTGQHNSGCEFCELIKFCRPD